jgi:hypothetical protein
MPDEPDVPEALDIAKEEERLDELGNKIEQVRRKVEDDLDPGHGEETFIGGGDSKYEDDQIVPPG